MQNTRCRIGMTALALSFVTLLLTVFPTSLFLRKIIILEQQCQMDKNAAYSFTLQCGEGQSCDHLSVAEKCAAELGCLRGRLRFCKLAMMLAATAAIGMALWSWRKEKAKAICLYSIFASLEAVSWQHIGTEFSASIALVLFIVLTAKLS
ncbi:MAG: hypothetical protein ACTFAL_14500 [Candidatus Electronema sp. V4]|uniref:hypothetical protein n=1 Tax=Candidatus Electronema sp. V4 TaxID=3454756 RepID=UPI0040554FB9